MKHNDGHIRLKRMYDGYSYIDITDYEIYYDSITKQYKVKFICGGCSKFLGWYCYDIDSFNIMMYECDTGMLCSECYQNENFDIDYEDCEMFEGQLCKC